MPPQSAAELEAEIKRAEELLMTDHIVWEIRQMNQIFQRLAEESVEIQTESVKLCDLHILQSRNS